MTFTDTALESLKKSADYAGAHEQSVIVYPDELNALIARLEAAEAVIGHCDAAHEHSMAPVDKADMAAWRKCSGK